MHLSRKFTDIFTVVTFRVQICGAGLRHGYYRGETIYELWVNMTTYLVLAFFFLVCLGIGYRYIRQDNIVWPKKILVVVATKCKANYTTKPALKHRIGKMIGIGKL